MSDKESLNNSENTVAESTPWDTLAEDAGTEAPAETMEEDPLEVDLNAPETPETPTPTPPETPTPTPPETPTPTPPMNDEKTHETFGDVEQSNTDEANQTFTFDDVEQSTPAIDGQFNTDEANQTHTYREVDPAQISEEQKDVVLRGMVNREQSSNRRIENAIKKNLSLEEQDKILDSEIKLQESQEALLNDMTSENETNQSLNEKAKEASKAMLNASDTYLSTIEKE